MDGWLSAGKVSGGFLALGLGALEPQVLLFEVWFFDGDIRLGFKHKMESGKNKQFDIRET